MRNAEHLRIDSRLLLNRIEHFFVHLERKVVQRFDVACLIRWIEKPKRKARRVITD